MTSLGTTGRWQVTTETALYLLDLDARTASRCPDAGAGPVPGLAPASPASLRRDLEPIPLLAVSHCEIGQPLVLILDLRGDGIPTIRRTTLVRDIRALDDAN